MMAMDTEGYERNVYQGFGNEIYGYAKAMATKAMSTEAIWLRRQ